MADWEVHANIISSMVRYMLNAKLNINLSILKFGRLKQQDKIKK